MNATVIRADARSLPLPDGSADLIVTSPPYFGLRSYTDGGEHYDGQLGSEAAPREYIANLLDCTREWVRVLKPAGSLFVNLGDKYSQRVATRPSSHQDGLFPNRPELRKDWKRDRAAGLARMPYENVIDDQGSYVREKSLLGLPWRYALGCIDDLGLILRAEIIWSKPNGLPESVTDRVRRSHEQVFHFVRQPRYYSAVDEVREAHVYGIPNSPGRIKSPHGQGFSRRAAETPYRDDRDHHAANPLGKLPASVWEIASQPLTVPERLGVDHFAAFPMELPRRIILGWSPPGVCVACGEGRRPVSTSAITGDRGGRQFNPASGNIGVLGKERVYHLTGYVCACPDASAPTRPSVVVDPFGGTGTTALVASMHGRHGISIDLSADYCRLARWRTRDPAERARALGVPKPPPVPDGQPSLFDDEEAV